MTPESVEILLVEDNPSDLELTLHALRKNKLANTIHIARDGEEALEFLFHQSLSAGGSHTLPKVILLDLKLPKVDGLEVLKAIRADERTRCVPVVVLTSSKEQQDIVTSYGLGVNSYIQKPVDFQQFQHAVQELGLYWVVVNKTPFSG